MKIEFFIMKSKPDAFEGFTSEHVLNKTTFQNLCMINECQSQTF